MDLDPSAARKALAAVRFVNGALGLLAPQVLLRRLGTDPTLDRSGVYPFRMFGVRTVLLAGDLVLRSSGAFGYTVRVLPKHDGLARPSELGLVANA